MSSDPTQKNKPVLPNETRPSQGGSGGSDSQMNTPGPRLTTGEPERPVLTDKSKFAPKAGETSKTGDGKQAERTGGQPRGDEGQRGTHGDAGRSFPDNRTNTGGSNPSQQQGKQGQPNPQSPMPAPKEGSTGSEHGGSDKQRDQKSGNVK